MATIMPGARVALKPDHLDMFSYPPDDCDLHVVVHEKAIKAKENALTTVMTISADGEIGWIGSLDESSVIDSDEEGVSLRGRIAALLFSGERVWQIIRPGLLLKPRYEGLETTVYKKSRPWVVLGRLENGKLLAAPLNAFETDSREIDAEEDKLKRWLKSPYRVQIREHELQFDGAKMSFLELAHLWSFPCSIESVGQVAFGARQRIEHACRRYVR